MTVLSLYSVLVNVINVNYMLRVHRIFLFSKIWILKLSHLFFKFSLSCNLYICLIAYILCSFQFDSLWGWLLRYQNFMCYQLFSLVSHFLCYFQWSVVCVLANDISGNHLPHKAPNISTCIMVAGSIVLPFFLLFCRLYHPPVGGTVRHFHSNWLLWWQNMISIQLSDKFWVCLA